MKLNFLRVILITMVTILFVACGSSSPSKITEEQNNIGVGNRLATLSPTTVQSKGTAVANKGPFKKGSEITAYKLNSDGSRILDKVVTTKTLDDTGIFSIEIPWTGLTELHIEGTYLNELTGKYMNDGSLSSIIDMKKDKKNEVGINLLTDISKKIIVGKMEQHPEGDFTKFEQKAKEVIVEQFNLDENLSFGTLDVTKKDNAGNIQLLELSAGLLATVDPQAVLDELVEAFKNVDEEDGELDVEGTSVLGELQEVKVDLEDVVGILGNNIDGVTIKSNLSKFNGQLGLKSKIRFPRINNALLDTNYTSEMVTINGIIGDVPANLSIDKGWYKINGALPAQKATTIKNGDTLELIETSSVNYSTKETMKVKIGKKRIRFIVKTISDKKANDGKPDKFTFGSKRNVPTNTEVTSDIMKVTGINVKANISIDKGEYSINDGEYTSSEGTVQNEDNITVRVKTGSKLGQKIVAKVTIGTDKSGKRIGKFVVHTERKDKTPEISGLFTTISGVEKSTSVTSNSIKVTDINVPVKVKIKGAEFSIDGGQFQSTALTIKNGQSIKIRATSSNNFDTKKEFLLNIGRVVIPFTVITKSNPITPDGTPDKFKFESLRTQEASKLIESNIITVSSINKKVTISIVNGEYSVNGGSYISRASTVKEGDKVQVRVTSATYGSEQIATLNIGGITALFSVKTIKDEIPNSVFFEPKLNVIKDSQVESNVVNITGINVPIPITVISGGEYSIDGGAYTSSSGTISNNQRLRVRLKSANSANTSSVSIIRVGQMLLTFVIITQDNAPKFKTSIVVPHAIEGKEYRLELRDFLEEGVASSWSMRGNPSWLTINPLNGRLTGVPIGDETIGSSIIIVTVQNYIGESRVTFNLVVDNTPDAPVAINDAITVEEDKNVTIDVLANDTDSDISDTKTIKSVTIPQNGTAIIVNKKILYTPNLNFNGVDSFSYTIKDSTNLEATATVNITVTAINDTPILTKIVGQTLIEDDLTKVIVLNATDVDSGDTIVFNANSSDTAFVRTNVVGNILTLTRLTNQGGTYTITVSASDGKASDIKSFTLTIPTIVVDREAPVVTLTGATDFDLLVGGVYIEEGATVTDNIDTNLRAIIANYVDVNNLGDYNVTYTATDRAGNVGRAIRIVHIIDNNSTNSSGVVTLPLGFDYRVINNLGEEVFLSEDRYKIEFYSNIYVSANDQVNHTGIVVKLNGNNLPTINIQETYKTKEIVAALYDVAGKLIFVSEPIVVNDINSVTIINLNIDNLDENAKVSITGKITYDRVHPKSDYRGLDYDNVTHEDARQVVIELINANDEVVATTTTDDNGEYLFSNLPQNSDVKVRVYTKMLKVGDTGWDVKVVDNTNSYAMYVMEGAMLSTGTTNSTRNLNASSSTRTAAPFAVLDNIYDGMKRVLSADEGIVFPPLVANWSVNNKTSSGDVTNGDIGTSYYSNGKLFILGDANGDTDEYDDHVIAHEWGHYYEDKFSRSDSIGGSHGSGDNLDIRVAFGEGFGNAMSAMSLSNPIYFDTYDTNASSGWSMNIESSSRNNPGWFSESSVQRILYDLFDSDDDGADTLYLGFARLHNVFVNAEKNTEAFTSIFSFITALKVENPDDVTAIDDIVSSESIATITDIYGTGRTNLADETPLYSSVNVGEKVNVCTKNSYGSYNKLNNRKYLKFSLSTSSTYTIKVEQSNGSNSDPDFRVYKAKPHQYKGASNKEEAGVEEKNFSLSEGDYLLDISDYTNQESACFDVSINQAS